MQQFWQDVEWTTVSLISTKVSAGVVKETGGGNNKFRLLSLPLDIVDGITTGLCIRFNISVFEKSQQVIVSY